MNMVLKVFLSMSFSGALLILALVCGERFLKHKISRQWQYYIWLIVILRLLLPFGPETNLMGKTYQAVDEAITQNTSLSEAQEPVNAPGNVLPPAVGSEPDNENTNSPVEELVTAHPLKDITSLLINHIWLIWLMVALGMLIRKVTIYQGFIRYINAGLSPVSDMGILDRLSVVAERVGIKKPIELCVNPVHLMSREITKACEFSCDEAVLTKMGYGNAQEYGNTLLDAMAAVGRYKENLGAVTLSENKQLLKERLGAIMKFKEQSRTVKMLTFALTLCVLLGAAFVGVFPVAAATDRTTRKPQVAVDKTPTQGNTSTSSKDYATQAERYYEADSLPLFEITFPRLDENTQKKWLEKFYADEDFAFFSVAVCWIDTNSALFTDFAEKAYDDEEMAFFSILIDCMDEAELELWLDRALEDGNWAFQSMLFDKLNRGEEFDELEEKQQKEWAEAQAAEYQAVGVTMDGKDYYYQGQLVNIFLDIRPNKSVYTLNMNPKGTVNIKIVRDAENKITGVSYMTEAEVTELLEDMSDPDDK